MRTADPLVPDSSAIEFEMDIGNLKRYKSPDIDQIPAEFFKQEMAKFTVRSIHLLILFAIKRN
jgi:hypothetical protein